MTLPRPLDDARDLEPLWPDSDLARSDFVEVMLEVARQHIRDGEAARLEERNQRKSKTVEDGTYGTERYHG
jgi:hypothetical protein